MQPREPQWDKPALSGPAILGCLLLVVVAAASGVGLWLIRSGQLRLPDLDRPSAATPTPPIAAPTTIEAAVPAPESSPLTADSLQKEIDQQVQQKSREMQARLAKGTVEGAWAPAPSSGEPPLDVHRVGGEIEPPRLISRVQPNYPEEARQTRVQGVVIVEAVIDPRGEVTNVRVLKGLPLGLDAAAVKAVKQWKFAPATLYGKPVAVYFVVTVTFKLE